MSHCIVELSSVNKIIHAVSSLLMYCICNDHECIFIEPVNANDDINVYMCAVQSERFLKYSQASLEFVDFDSIS